MGFICDKIRLFSNSMSPTVEFTTLFPFFVGVFSVRMKTSGKWALNKFFLSRNNKHLTMQIWFRWNHSQRPPWFLCQLLQRPPLASSPYWPHGHSWIVSVPASWIWSRILASWLPNKHCCRHRPPKSVCAEGGFERKL